MNVEQHFPLTELIDGCVFREHHPDRSEFYCPGIYFAFAGKLVKIGKTYRPNARFNALRSPIDKPIERIVFVPQALFSGITIEKAESVFHDSFPKYKGEWFYHTDEIQAIADSFAGLSIAFFRTYRDWFKSIRWASRHPYQTQSTRSAWQSRTV